MRIKFPIYRLPLAVQFFSCHISNIITCHYQNLFDICHQWLPRLIKNGNRTCDTSFAKQLKRRKFLSREAHYKVHNGLRQGLHGSSNKHEGFLPFFFIKCMTLKPKIHQVTSITLMLLKRSRFSQNFTTARQVSRWNYWRFMPWWILCIEAIYINHIIR